MKDALAFLSEGQDRNLFDYLHRRHFQAMLTRDVSVILAAAAAFLYSREFPYSETSGVNFYFANASLFLKSFTSGRVNLLEISFD